MYATDVVVPGKRACVRARLRAAFVLGKSPKWIRTRRLQVLTHIYCSKLATADLCCVAWLGRCVLGTHRLHSRIVELYTVILRYDGIRWDFWPYRLHVVCRCGLLLHSVVVVFAGHTGELCKNGWTDRDAFGCGLVTAVGPRILVLAADP